MAFVALIGLSNSFGGIARLRTWALSKRNSTDAVTGPGFIETTGAVEPLGEAVTPPATDTDAVVYEYTRREYQQSVDADDGGRSTAESVRDTVPVVVSTGAGSVVDSDGADFSFEVRETEDDDRHITEQLAVGQEAYVAGEAVPARDHEIDTDHSYVVANEGDGLVSFDRASITGPPFFVSDGDETTAESELFSDGAKQFGIGVGPGALVAAAVVLL